ncbi:MAG TPA: hypothetical protein VI958_03870, partial [Acidobacteriota bacterium]
MLGWFPLQTTGFRGISVLQPGTQLRFSKDQSLGATVNVIQDWLHSGPMPAHECLELARSSLLDGIRAGRENWEKPSVGLSGGWDSRAVVSSLRYQKVDFSARVRGLPDRKDVPIAKELARLGGFEIRHKTSGGLPPDDADSCKRSITLALLWQAGAMVMHKQKSFLSQHKHLDGGVVNVMGQHGEIGRAYYAKMIRADQLHPSAYETELLARLTKKLTFIKTELQEIVKEIIMEAYRQADRYQVRGLSRLDFFYLFERTRRWASGSLNSQTGLVVAPFLNPDYIRATFSYPNSKQDNPFHRYIIEKNSPEWMGVPYAKDVDRLENSFSADSSLKKSTKGGHYDSETYWRSVGRPILAQAMSRESQILQSHS